MAGARRRADTGAARSPGRERPADRRRIPRHPRRRHPRSGRRGPRGEKAVAGDAAVQSLRWSEDDQGDDPRHVAHDDHRLSHRRDPRSSCQARSSTAIQPGGSAWSPPPRPPASRRSRWGWGCLRDPLDPCSATPVPPRSPPPRRWRGGELSEDRLGGPLTIFGQTLYNLSTVVDVNRPKGDFL